MVSQLEIEKENEFEVGKLLETEQVPSLVSYSLAHLIHSSSHHS
jgi:hypothetical protein